jgi:hypothetical protein
MRLSTAIGLNAGIIPCAGIGLSTGIVPCAGIGLSAGIGPGEGFGPGIIGAACFGVGIAGRPGMAIVAEFGKPVAHLGPAVFLGNAAVVMADLDLHVRSPVDPGISAGQRV